MVWKKKDNTWMFFTKNWQTLTPEWRYMQKYSEYGYFLTQNQTWKGEICEKIYKIDQFLAMEVNFYIIKLYKKLKI